MSLWRDSLALRVTAYIVLALLVLVVAPWIYLDWKTSRDLEAELQRIRDAGEPVRLPQAVPDVPDADNAAVLYEQVFGPDFTGGVLCSGYSSIIETDYLTGSATDAEAREVFAEPSVVDALRTLERASRRGRCVFPVEWNNPLGIYVRHHSAVRTAARWLLVKSQVSAAAGDLDEALRWCEVSLRISEHISQEPLLIGQLTCYATQTMALSGARKFMQKGAPSPRAASAMIAYLRSVEMAAALRRACVGERAQAIDVFNQVWERRVEMVQALSGTQTGHDTTAWLLYLYASPIGRPLVNVDELIMLQTWRDWLALLEADGSRARLYERLHAMADLPRFAVITDFTYVPDERTVQRMHRATAELDLFEVALAAEVYRSERGEWPANLQQLQDTLSYDLPHDPFARGPYHYRRENDGFVVWALGTDLDDDGGHGMKDSGYDRENCDIVWRVRR